MIHIISDLNLYEFDHASEHHFIPKDANFCIIPGNISTNVRRSIIFGEKLALKYPEKTIIYNYGFLELGGMEIYKVRDTFNTRLSYSELCPKNIHFGKGKIVGNYDIYCTEGFPYISKSDYTESLFSKKYIMALNGELYIGDRLVCQRMPVYFSYDYYMEQLHQEIEGIKIWLEKSTGYKKLLVTGCGLTSGKSLGLNNFTFFPNLDLNEVLWVSTGDNSFVGHYQNSKVIISPGYDRSLIY